MLSYYATALALKAFSINGYSEQLYRSLGNARNAIKSETEIAVKYYFRTPIFLETLRRHNVLKPGIKALEIGTGFVHWEALVLRNEIPCDVQLYDIWDNRTYHRFQSYARHLANPQVRERLGLSVPENQKMMEEVLALPDFDAVYRRLGFDYKLDPSGLLQGVDDTAFDLVVSSDVGEHLRREDIPAIIRGSFEVLKPGGWAFHQVCLVDHLRIYAGSTHPKQYLSFSKAHYARYLNNGVQYINQVQVPEWKAMFEGAGFEIAALDRIGTADLTGLSIHPDWSGISEEDLSCTVVVFMVRKPLNYPMPRA